MGPAFKAPGPSLARVRSPWVIQSDLVSRSLISRPYTTVLTCQASDLKLHTEVYGYGLARWCLGAGGNDWQWRRHCPWSLGAAAHDQTSPGSCRDADLPF